MTDRDGLICCCRCCGGGAKRFHAEGKPKPVGRPLLRFVSCGCFDAVSSSLHRPHMEPGQDNYALLAALQGTMRVPTHPPTAAWVEPPPPSYDVVAASQPRAAEALPSWLSASTTAATPIGANAAVPRLHSVLDPWRAAHVNGSALQQPLPATDAVSLDAYIATRPPAGVESLLAQYLQTTGTTTPSSVGNHPRTGHTAEASVPSYHAVSFHDLVQHGDVTAAAAAPTNSITTDPCQHMDPTFSDVDRADFRKLRFNEKYASLYPFQQEVFCRALQKSSILYLPTGAGKTIVAAALAAYRHAVNPTKKVVFVVNRVPLVSQQAHVLHRFGLRVAQVCGEKKDASSWEEVAEYFDAVVIIDALLIEMVTRTSTSLFDGCSLIIFDEIHHARKSSNYSKLLQLMGKGDRPHVVGLSASPSARESPDKTRKALEELMGLTRCQLVSVLRETADLEARVSVPVSELIEYAPSNMEKALDEAIRNAIRWIEKIVIPAIRNDNPSAAYPLEGCVGLPYGSPQYVTKCREAQTALLQAFKTGAGTLATLLGVLNQALILLEEWSACDAANFIVSNPSLNAVFPDLEKSFHSLVEEERLDRKIAWHLQMIIGPLYCTILNLIRRGLASHQVSTKMQLLFHVLQEVVGKEDSEELKNFRGIVFCETKAATVEITTRLQSTPLGKLLRPTYFVGHGRTLVDLRDVSYSIAMSDAKQQKTLQAFREGEIKLLIATSVAEEGLDIPMCNLVVRYEGVFSVQSFIQSRGRARKRNSHFIVISKMTPANPFADVLRDCAMQDTIVKEMCMLDQDAVIAGAETSTGPMRVFEADPLKFLLQVEHTHGATIHMEDRPCKGGVEVIVTVALPDGTNIRGTGVGNQQRASQEARLRVVQQLYNNGYIRGDSLVESFSASTELKRFRYFANPSVALTNAKTASSALTTPLTAGPPAPEITVYDEDHWGTYVKPFVLLDRHLRERGFQAPRAKTTPQQANDGTSVSVEFQMRVNGGGGAPEVKWFYLPGSGATWEIALQTAALSALRALGVNVTLRPHSINSNTTEATATVTQGS